jgi:hypothetical protein
LLGALSLLLGCAFLLLPRAFLPDSALLFGGAFSFELRGAFAFLAGGALLLLSGGPLAPRGMAITLYGAVPL